MFFMIVFIVGGVGVTYLATGSLWSGLLLLSMIGLAVLLSAMKWLVETRRRR